MGGLRLHVRAGELVLAVKARERLEQQLSEICVEPDGVVASSRFAVAFDLRVVRRPTCERIVLMISKS